MKEESSVLKKVVFIAALIACLTPWISPPLALALGIIVAQAIGTPYAGEVKKATKLLLQASVVGLGFGMNLNAAFTASKEGVVFTVVSVVSTMLLGYLLGKKLKISKNSSYLISSGTAICGGSAIAAIAPIIKADESDTSVSLGTIFILNSIALFIFPIIGHYLGMSETNFGLWSAIAIHDTSSVAGAAQAYGPEALKVALTVKLARALWIIPLAFFTSYIFKNKYDKIQIPWFIFLYIVAMGINSYAGLPTSVTDIIVLISKKGLTLTLFLIGSGLTLQVMKKVGVRPLIHGVLLWIFIGLSSLAVISFFGK